MSKEICPILGKSCIREKCGAYTEGRTNFFGMPIFDKEITEIVPDEVKFETTGHLWWKKTVKVVICNGRKRILKHIIGSAYSIHPSCKLVEDYPFGVGRVEVFEASSWRELRHAMDKDEFWVRYRKRLSNPKEVKRMLGIK